MYQVSMFSNAFRGQKYLGEGMFANVSSMGNGWVVKTATSRDCTLNYLEWCKRKQAAGEGMQGMPEIDFIVHTEEGYIVTMRQYTPQDVSPWSSTHSECEYIQDLVTSFEVYMFDTFGEFRACNDLHAGNVMLDTGMYVMTDPSSRPYRADPDVTSFGLQPTWSH